MKTIILAIFIIISFSSNAYPLDGKVSVLTQISTKDPNKSRIFPVDPDKLSKSPSWSIGEKIPLSETELTAIIERILFDIKDKIISINLRKVDSPMTIWGKPFPQKFNDKWFYVVSWESESNTFISKSVVILLDGTIVHSGCRTRHTEIFGPNQRVDPTVKTPVESGNEQGTAGHP